MSRSRAYCFTINNWVPEDLIGVLEIPTTYTVVGREKGKEDTPHLQGYLYFKTVKSFGQIKKLLPRAHIEAAKGTPVQAAEYCKKDGDYEERGECPMSQDQKGQCTKRRWDDARQLAREGRFEEIDSELYIKYQTSFKKIRSDCQEMPESIPVLQNQWIWGPSGSGKSRKAREENPGAYIKNVNKWWCGYKDQDTVIIDEWSPDHKVLTHHLKVWADHHPFQAETKGSSMCIRPKKLVITSNYAPDECFEKTDLEPILRRFHVIYKNMDSEYTQ